MCYSRAPLPLYLLGSLTAYSRNLGASGLGNPFAKLQVTCGWVILSCRWSDGGIVAASVQNQDTNTIQAAWFLRHWRGHCTTSALL